MFEHARRQVIRPTLWATLLRITQINTARTIVVFRSRSSCLCVCARSFILTHFTRRVALAPRTHCTDSDAHIRISTQHTHIHTHYSAYYAVEKYTHKVNAEPNRPSVPIYRPYCACLYVLYYVSAPSTIRERCVCIHIHVPIIYVDYIRIYYTYYYSIYSKHCNGMCFRA